MALLNGARLLMLEKEEDKVAREIPVRTGQVQIGSNPTLNTIRLSADGVEQIHCRIFVKNEKVVIANYSVENPILVDNAVVSKRTALNDGSILEICGTRFRWKFDESKLAGRQTPTSSKHGSRRRTTIVRKKLTAVGGPGGSGKKPAIKKAAPQRTSTYTIPKNHKQLLKNIRKRFTVANIMTKHSTEDVVEEENTDCDDTALPEEAASPKPATPQKSSSATSSAANTPFFTPELEKENSVPMQSAKTPRTPMLQLENSAMMILSYTPAIGNRSKANIQKTPLSAAKSAQRLLTPKNENISNNATPLKSKAGNSMYLIDLTTPNSGHSSFVCSPMLETTASSIDSTPLRLIDLTTPSPKMVKTPSSVLKSTQQKTLLKSALKNASKTPRTALRSVTGTPVTPKTVPKITLNDTPIRLAVSTRSNKTPVSASKGKIRSQLDTPTSNRKLGSARKEVTKTPSATPTVEQPDAPPNDDSIMTTDELFDTLVGRQSVNLKTYERKSTSPKKTPCPLVIAEDTSDMPKTDIDLWVESVVAAVTSPEPVNMDGIIRKPNRTTQVRSSQYSDITPHESFAEGTAATASGSETVVTQPETDVVQDNSPDELENMNDVPTIPSSNRRSETPLASKIARSLGNKRQTIGNFFTNIFGKLTVSPVTRISIADDSMDTSEVQEQKAGEDSDGSEEIFHDSETDHGEIVPAPSPKLRQSLRDTRKFIGDAWTSLNTSRPQLDNTAEIDESLLLSDTYNETTDDGNDTAPEHYDLTDLGSRPSTAQAVEQEPPTGRTPTQRRSVRSTSEFDISPLATPLESTPNKALHEATLDQTDSFVISPDVVKESALQRTPVSRRLQQNITPTSTVTSSTTGTPARRSTRRITIEPMDSIDIPAPEPSGETSKNVEETPVQQQADNIPQELSYTESSQAEQHEAAVENSQNQPMIFDVSNKGKDEEQAIEKLSQSLLPTSETSVTLAKSDSTISDGAPVELEISQKETSLKVVEDNDDSSIAKVDQTKTEAECASTPMSKDFVARQRGTRNSIAVTRVATPSETKIPLRKTRKTIAEMSSMAPEKASADDSRCEIDTLEISTEKGDAQADDESDQCPNVVDTEADSHVGCEELCQEPIETEQDMQTSAVCTLDVPSSPVVRDELKQSSVRRSRRSVLKISIVEGESTSISPQTATEPIVESTDDTFGQEMHSSTVNLEHAAETNETVGDDPDSSEVEAERSISNKLTDGKRNTRKSFAAITPKPAAPIGKIPMSESKLPLRRMPTVESDNLQRCVKESPVEQTQTPSGLEVDNVIPNVEEPIKDPEQSVAENNSVVDAEMTSTFGEDHTSDATANTEAPITPEQARISAQSTPVSNVRASPARSSRSSARKEITPQKTANTSTMEVKATPKTAPLLKRVLQKATQASTTKAVQSPNVKPNESNEDTSLKLDLLYKTPTRVTRGKQSLSVETSVSTPGEVTDTSLQLDELYKTPARVTRGNVTVASAKSLVGTPKDADATMLNDSQTSTSLPVASGTFALETSAEAVDSITVETSTSDAGTSELETDADMSLNLQEMYKTPTRALRGTPPLSAAKQVTGTPKQTPEKSVPAEADTSSQLSTVKNVTGTPKETTHSVTAGPNASINKDVDMSLNLQEMYKTPARIMRGNFELSAIKNVAATPTESTQNVSAELNSSVSEEVEADMSLNLQEMYKTPARTLRGTPQLSATKQVTKTPKQTPKKSVISTPAEADMSLNLQEMYKTPARTLRGNSELSAIENVAPTPIESTQNVSTKLNSSFGEQVETDMSLNIMEMYKTPARRLRGTPQLSAAKQNTGTPKQTPKKSVIATPAEADMSLNLQEMYKTPARILRGSSELSAIKNVAPTPTESTQNISAKLNPSVSEPVETDMSLNLQEMYKTPAQALRASSQLSAVKNNIGTPSETDHSAATGPNVSVAEPSEVDMSLNLQEMYKTPARTVTETPKETVTKSEAAIPSTMAPESEADESLNLQQLYKTPARTLRGISQLPANTKVVTTPNSSVCQPAEADMTLNLQEMYKTPARDNFELPSKTPQKVLDKSLMNEIGAPATEADMSLNLNQLYKTPARTLRGVSQLTPAEASTSVCQAVEQQSDADMTLNLDQMYKTPARPLRGNAQQSAVKTVEQAEATGTPDVSLNLQQLYKTPARALPDSSRLSDETPQNIVDKSAVNVTPAKPDNAEEADMSLNLQPLYKTPARTLRGNSQSPAVKIAEASGTPKEASNIEPVKDVTLNLQALYKTPARPMPNDSVNVSAQAKIEESNISVEPLFKTPARTTRGRLPQSSAKATTTGTPRAETVTPSRASRSMSKAVSIHEPYMSLVESEMTTSIAGESMYMGSESDEVATSKAISSTPFHGRTRKSTLVAAVGMMSPLNSSDTTFTSEMHTEAIGITTLDRTSMVGEDSAMTDRMQTMAGIFVAAQSRLDFDESVSPDTVLGDPLGISNVVEPLSNTQRDSTTEIGATVLEDTMRPSTAVNVTESLDQETPIQEETLIEDSRNERSTVNQVPQSSALITSNNAETPVQNAPEADTSLHLQELNKTPARTLRNTTRLSVVQNEKVTVSPTTIPKESVTSEEPNKAPDVSLNLQHLYETPARTLRTKNTPQKTDNPTPSLSSSTAEASASTCKDVEPKSKVDVSLEPSVSTVESPKAAETVNSLQLQKKSTPAAKATKLICETPNLEGIFQSPARSTRTRPSTSNIATTPQQPMPTSSSKKTVTVNVDISITEQGQNIVVEPAKVETPKSFVVVNSPVTDDKSDANIPDVVETVVPAVTLPLETGKLENSSTVNEAESMSSSIIVDVESGSLAEETGSASHIDTNSSLVVDPSLLRHIHERVDNLEREIAEMNDMTQNSSTSLEGSQEPIQDLQESEIETIKGEPEEKNQTKSKRGKRRLYTKASPDESTPERRESLGTHPAVNKDVYKETSSGDKKGRRQLDTSSEVDEPKKVEQPAAKVLPSRASRKKITSLSEEVLAGASPEVKYVKPKPPKVAAVEDVPQINTSASAPEAEPSEQETSLGRRKVAFNEHIQVKEINSPAFVGEVIKKTSQRGRGRNNKQAVTVTVDQTHGQTIKPATKRGKAVDPDPPQVTPETDNISAVEVPSDESGKAPETSSEQGVEPSVSEEPSSKRNRAANANTTKNEKTEADGESQLELPEQSSEVVTDEPEVKPSRTKKGAAAKPNTKRSRRGPKEEDSAVTEPLDKEASEVSGKQEAEEPVTKRTRRAPKSKTENAVEKNSNDSEEQTTSASAEIEVKAPSRSRRGQKQVTKSQSSDTDRITNATHDTTEANEVGNEKQEAASEEKSNIDAKSKSRRGAKKVPANKKVTSTEETEKKPQETITTDEEIVQVQPTEAQETPIETTMKEEQPENMVESTSQRGAKTKPTSKKESTIEAEAAPLEPVESTPADDPNSEQELARDSKPKSRRGAKKATSSEKTVQDELPADKPVENMTATKDEELEKDAKPKPRRGAKKAPVDKKATFDEEVVFQPTEAQETATKEEQPDNIAESKSRRGARTKPTNKEATIDKEIVEPVEPNTEQEIPKSRRGAKKATVDVEVSSSVNNHIDESSSRSQAEVKKSTRRGRGAHTAVAEPEVVPEPTIDSMVVEKAIADSTSSDEPVAADDAPSAVANTKRSRRGAKGEPAVIETSEPATKRTRRAPKSKANLEDPKTDETVEQDEAKSSSQEQIAVETIESRPSPSVEKPSSKRTKRTAKKVDVAETETVEAQETNDANQEASEDKKSTENVKPTARRGAKKNLVDSKIEEQTEAKIASPLPPPPVADEQTGKRGGRQAARRAPKKVNNQDPPLVEESLNESHMVKTMLPSSHTSTPLTRTVIPDAEVPSGTRGRKAANPVIAALIEESTPRTRSRRGESEPKEQVEVPVTPTKRGRGRGAATKAKSVQDEPQQPEVEAPQSSVVVADSEESTSKPRARGKKAAKVAEEVVANVEPATEKEPPVKRIRKVPAKLQEAVDDLGAEKAHSSRGRRGAKAKTEESATAAATDDQDETAEVSAAPSVEPKKKNRTAAKRTVKKADLKDESVAEEVPKSPPPKRTRKGAR